MLQKRISDFLLLFCAGGIVLLWILFPQVKQSVFKEQPYRTVDLDLRKELYLPPTVLTDSAQIYTYNPNVDLYYSLDGGKNFTKAPNNKLELKSLKNASILYQQTALRWRHPKGDFPRMLSLVIKIKDHHAKIMSPPNHYAFIPAATVNESLPIVNLSVAENELFGWQNGIMIMGEQATHQTGFNTSWWYRNANFTQRGLAWTKRVNFTYFEDQQLKVQQYCALKISGNASRAFPQKSLRLYPTDLLEREDKMEYRFFGKKGNKKTESLWLRQSGNDNSRTLFADIVMQRLAENSKVTVLKGFPVTVFLNGNYWGIYNFRERPDKYWVAKQFDVKSKEVTILNSDGYGLAKLKSGKKKYQKSFEELIEKLLKEKSTTKKTEKALKTEIDWESFTDYIIFETFYANQDWLSNNVTWFYIEDQKWRWILNDLDCGLAYMGEGNVNANMFTQLQKSTAVTAILYQALMKDASFKKQFKKRAKEIVTEHFSTENIHEVFNKTQNQYRNDIEKQIRRWRFIDSKEAWETHAKNNLNFLLNRGEIYLNQVDQL